MRARVSPSLGKCVIGASCVMVGRTRQSGSSAHYLPRQHHARLPLSRQ